MNGRFPKIISLIAIVTLLFTACQSENIAPALSPTEDPVVAMQAALQATAAAGQADRSEQIARWLAELDAAESRWENANVHKYTLTTFYVNSSQSILQYNTIIVENGEIIADSAACSEQAPNCFIKDIDLQNITVPGLFGMIRSALNNDQIVDNGTQFNFDQTYGVPEWISLKTSGQFPWYWHVESFEIIE